MEQQDTFHRNMVEMSRRRVEDLDEKLKLREAELVDSGFVEARKDTSLMPISNTGKSLQAFYYVIGREIELCADPQYKELYDLKREVQEVRSFHLYAPILRNLNKGQGDAIHRLRHQRYKGVASS